MGGGLVGEGEAGEPPPDLRGVLFTSPTVRAVDVLPGLGLLCGLIRSRVVAPGKGGEGGAFAIAAHLGLAPAVVALAEAACAYGPTPGGEVLGCVLGKPAGGGGGADDDGEGLGGVVMGEGDASAVLAGVAVGSRSLWRAGGWVGGGAVEGEIDGDEIVE